MHLRPRRLWRAFIRLLILLLLAALGFSVYLALNPGALGSMIHALPLPGVVSIPTAGPTPPLPVIAAAPGAIPAGPLAFYGGFEGGTISCGFLMRLADGRLVGVTAAHATADLPPGTPAFFFTPQGERAADLVGPLRRGSPFVGEQFTLDYVLWAVTGRVDAAHVLLPDGRAGGQPGEPVWVYGPGADGKGSESRWAGVVMRTGPTAIWIQLAEAFNPAGLSGCPVVSAITGRLIGMAVAGENQPPVVMGLNPVGSLVEKAGQ